jgi:nucleoside-diphosphate-sugar epimerase
MKILLTGGTGFLGSHIAEALVAGGHELRCSVRKASDTRWLDGLEIEIVELDLGSPGDSGPRRRSHPVPTAIEGMECVVHCGALTRAPDEARFVEVNADGTRALAQAAADAGVGRFVLISSLAARGPDGAAGPISPYGRSKALAESYLAELDGDLEKVVLRPAGVYGPRDSDLLPLFRMATRGVIVVPSSRAELQPVYVADVVTAVVAAVSAVPPPHPLPIAHGARHTWAELAAALSGAVGRAARVIRLPSAAFWTAGLLSELGALVTHGSPAMDRRRARDLSHHRWTCDIEVTRAALDWSPVVDIRGGLERTAEWYREAGWL